MMKFMDELKVSVTADFMQELKSRVPERVRYVQEGKNPENNLVLYVCDPFIAMPSAKVIFESSDDKQGAAEA